MRNTKALTAQSINIYPRVTLIIPCLNEERCVRLAVELARKVFLDNEIQGEILVVDNGSADNTVRLAEAAGARVVQAHRSGYGEALRTGFANAAHEIVAIVDADLSYPLEDFPRLLDALESGADLVLGNRLHGRIEPGAMPWLNRYVGTPVLSWLIRRLHGVQTYDCNSGFRVLRRSQLLAMNLRSSGMELASEILIGAGKLSLRYAEVAIDFRRDQRGRPPHLNRWRDGLRHLRVIGRGVPRTVYLALRSRGAF